MQEQRNITELLIHVRAHVAAGLSLTAAGARVGVLRRPVVSWVRLADEGVEPFASWLTAIMAYDAERRAAQMARLTTLAERTNRKGHWASRDLERMRGAQTELERELRDIRKEYRTRQGSLDAWKLKRKLTDEL